MSKAHIARPRLVRAALSVLLAWCLIEVLIWRVGISKEMLEKSAASSLSVRDQRGAVLRQEATSAGFREDWKTLEEISPHLIHATLASEDHRFYAHDGVDYRALGRAFWLNLKGASMSYGASTLSMQLARTLAPSPRSLWGKIKQIAQAKSLERRLTKSEILEHYLNRVFYGQGAWGAEQAARLYFDKSALALSAGEAAVLAVFPRGPVYYNVFRHKERVMTRQRHIVGLMEEKGWLNASDADLAKRAPVTISTRRPSFLAPHFVEYVKEQLTQKFARAATVETTLDLQLQHKVEVALRRHVEKMSPKNMTQAAAVVLRNSDGAVLAMVGSNDYHDADASGAFNGVTARLRPGSTLKPFVYGAAMSAGDTPATLAYDVILPNEGHQFYTKDVKQHGFARYRESLASSFNLSAVHTLQRAGLPAVLRVLRRAGLETLDMGDSEYDWGLAIGHAEVRLLDLTAAFSTFARGGVPVRPRAVASATSVTGETFEAPITMGTRVFSEEVSYQIFDILSDPDARKPMFGDRVPMNLPFKVALKTGTTKAYTDLWAVGITKEYSVGVWGGNFDGAPTHKVKSVQGATPLVRAIYVALAASYGDPSEPTRPSTLVAADVCPLSGMKPGKLCDHRKSEWFKTGSLPGVVCNWHREIGGEVRVVYPPELESWARVFGKNPARVHGRDALQIVSPMDGSTFHLEAHRPARSQKPPTRAAPSRDDAKWFVDGVALAKWNPSPGRYVLRVEAEGQHDEVTIYYE